MINCFNAIKYFLVVRGKSFLLGRLRRPIYSFNLGIRAYVSMTYFSDHHFGPNLKGQFFSRCFLQGEGCWYMFQRVFPEPNAIVQNNAVHYLFKFSQDIIKWYICKTSSFSRRTAFYLRTMFEEWSFRQLYISLTSKERLKDSTEWYSVCNWIYWSHKYCSG